MPQQIITLLIGGLGNQLFQYAASLEASRQTGITDRRYLLFQGQWPGEPILSDVVPVRVERPSRMDRATVGELAQDPSPLNPFFRRTASISESRGWTNTLRVHNPFERCPHLTATARIVLAGYFQHPSWWAMTWRTVAVEMLVTREGLGVTFEPKHVRFALQVRRGDYASLGWDLPAAYYRDALELLDWRDTTVGCSTHETLLPDWLHAEFTARSLSPKSAEMTTGNRTLNDFWSLADADELIAANSTFAWWAAAAATAHSRPRRIVYPVPWIPNSWTSEVPPDMGLPGWIPLPSGLPATR